MPENKVEKSNKKMLIDKIRTNKKLQVLIIFILSIICLFILLGNFSENEKKYEVDEVTLYVSNLEDRLEEVLSKVAGAGSVSVVINVESGKETVLAMETKKEKNGDKIITEEKPLVVNGKTIVLRELTPRITGVIIVAEGAKNISVLSKISQATQSLLNINSNQIEILSMK